MACNTLATKLNNPIDVSKIASILQTISCAVHTIHNHISRLQALVTAIFKTPLPAFNNDSYKDYLY
jgi:hypothetical protein